MNSCPFDMAKDDVLAAFVTAHALPSSKDVRSWSARYPVYGKAFYRCASDLHEAAERDIVDPQPTEGEREGIWQRHLADVAAYLASLTQHRFAELVETCDKTFAALADQIGIDARILERMEAGGIRVPANERLITAVATALGVSLKTLDAALMNSYRQPDLGAVDDHQSYCERITFTEAVACSAMSDEQKAFWIRG